MYRFSLLPYVNALPLTHFLGQISPHAEFIYRVPRRSAGALLTGEVDAALVPLIDFFEHRNALTAVGLGICADGDVTSVLLQCRRPLQTVRTVQLDPESRTSNTLIQVLMRDHFKVEHAMAYLQDGAIADARVCIGDRALCSPPTAETYDLAGEWKSMSDLPFVFAVWAVRCSCSNMTEISEILHRAKELGCRSIEMLASIAAERLNLPAERCRDYLEHRLHYDLGPREHQAVGLFRQLAADLPNHHTATALPSIVSHAGPETKVSPRSQHVETVE